MPSANACIYQTVNVSLLFRRKKHQMLKKYYALIDSTSARFSLAGDLVDQVKAMFSQVICSLYYRKSDSGKRKVIGSINASFYVM